MTKTIKRESLYHATSKLDINHGIFCFNGMALDYSDKADRDRDMEGPARCFWYAKDDYKAFTDDEGTGPQEDELAEGVIEEDSPRQNLTAPMPIYCEGEVDGRPVSDIVMETLDSLGVKSVIGDEENGLMPVIVLPA